MNSYEAGAEWMSAVALSALCAQQGANITVSGDDRGTSFTLTAGARSVPVSFKLVQRVMGRSRVDVEVEGDQGEVQCRGLDCPNAWHELRVKAAGRGVFKETAYGIGSSNFEHQLLAFILAIRRKTGGKATEAMWTRPARLMSDLRAKGWKL